MPRKRQPRQRDFTDRYHAGSYDADNIDAVERLDGREKNLRTRKIAETAELRLAGETEDADALPLGRVRQVYSLYAEVDLVDSGQRIQCTVRKTLTRRSSQAPVVGDIVRLRRQVRLDVSGPEEGVIERVEPRTTLLTRADSFKALVSHPIVSNATHMMIVVSVDMPQPKWGLVDRMLVAARGGGLAPVICLNKIDLGELAPPLLDDAREVMAHYRKLGITAEETCATRPGSEDKLRGLLQGRRTVLAGHSGVGKSSLVNLIAPKLDIRIGEVSAAHQKGRHTTTSARVYDLLDLQAEIIDTPGVKLFGLWNVTEEALAEFYPDVDAGWAPQWRIDSHARIAASLGARET